MSVPAIGRCGAGQVHRRPVTRPVPRLACALAFLVAACGGRAGAPADVKLGYFANLTHAQAVLGVSSGELAGAVAPATLTTHVFNAGPSLVEALFAGEVDIGYVGPGPALNGFLKSRGRGLRIVAGAAANGVAIVARPGSGIARLEDLRGKRVATPQLGNTQDISARHYLVSVLGAANANDVVPVPNAEQATMMSHGEIDAAWVPEPWGAWLESKAGATLVAEEKDLWPGREFTLAVVVTTPEFLAAHPDTVRRVLAVHRAWTARLTHDPRSVLPRLGDALNALTGKALPPEVYAAAFARTRFTDEPLEETVATMGRWSYELGFSPQSPELTGLVDTTILRELEGAIPAAPPAAR